MEGRFEDSTAEAIYCPVLEDGRWNSVMEELHRQDPSLARSWRESRHRPTRKPAGGGQVTKVLALPSRSTRKQWVLYCYEGDRPGSGLADAARYAERAGLKSLAVDGRNRAWADREECRRAVAETTAVHETAIIVHHR